MNPASEHPHVIEGICTCEKIIEEYGSFLGGPMQHVVGIRYSLQCGLSTHRVKAAAQNEIQWSHK